MLRNLPVDLRKRERLRKEDRERAAREQQARQNLKKSVTTRVEEPGFDFKKLLSLFARRWYILLVGVAIGLTGAYLVNAYSVRVFKSELIFHICEEQSPFSRLDAGLGLEEESRSAFVEKLIAVLRSRSHNSKIIQALDLRVKYQKEKGLSVEDLYRNSPFFISFIDSTQSPCVSAVYVTGGDHPTMEFLLTKAERANDEFFSSLPADAVVDEGSVTVPFTWGEPVSLFGCNMLPSLNEEVEFDPNANYSFSVISEDALIKDLLSRLSIAEAFDSEFIFKMSLEGSSPQRADDYPNTSIQLLQEYEVEQKNQQAENTIRFIRSQILHLTDTINIIQARMSAHRRLNATIDLSSEGQMLFEKRTTLQENLAGLTYKEQYFAYLSDYLRKGQNYYGLLAPSTARIEDQLLHKLVTDVVNLSIELQELQVSVQEESPVLNRKKQELDAIKRSLAENVDNLENGVRIEKAALSEELKILNKKIASLPGKEQAFIDIQRQFEVTNEQLVYLLRKLSETEMMKAGTTPNTAIIDEAVYAGTEPIRPVPSKNYLIGFLLGLGIPAGLLAAFGLLGDKILSEADVIQATGIPVAGRVFECPFDTQNVVFDFSDSPTAESFRGIRSNIRFALQDSDSADSKIILITSSVGGEGKTFTSINLAESFASAGLRTVLVELDLRKPKVFSAKGVSNDKGITSYLFGQHTLEEIIRPLEGSHLDLVTSGPLSPNPSELFVSKKFEKLVHELKERYDFIVFDTAPLGLVSDTNELMKFADVNLYLVRYNYSRKSHLEPLVSYHQEKRAKRLYLVLNDIPKSEKGSFGYGFGYDKGYKPAT